jgi:uncharacterized protein YbdZ (MbtH family)
MTWNDPEGEDTTVYKIVTNHEEQYSIWPDHKEIPQGWKHAGKTGLKPECRAWIKEVWTDMQPLSLRKRIEDFANSPRPPRRDLNTRRTKSLVERLCEGDHPVEIALRPESGAKALKEAIDRGYIRIRFTQTMGGTELGFPLDRDTSDFSEADVENGKGTIHLEGNLTLDYVKVKCVTDIDLRTLNGKGSLAKVEADETSVA